MALVRRQIFFFFMIVIPIFCALFFFSLMDKGTVQRVPVGIVDLDQSDISRALTRNLGALQTVDIQYHFRNYQEAVDAVRRGRVLGFFYIPRDLSRRALNGEQPTVSYYINYAYFTPGSMQYKGFKTITVLANGGIVSTALRTVGLQSDKISATIMPVVTHMHGLNNPYINYSYYMNTPFVPCMFELLIFLLTAFSIGTEFKFGTCQQWLHSSGGSISVAILGKMLPMFLIFTSVGIFIQFLMYRVYGFPLNCNPWHMILAMMLFVLACQGWALLAMCFCPNFRYGTTLCALMGMLAFSFCGFSLPQEAMYPWVEAIGFLVPVKYYFLISVDQALNGIPFYYSRLYYAVLIVFAVLPWFFKRRIKRECGLDKYGNVNPKHPFVYVP